MNRWAIFLVTTMATSAHVAATPVMRIDAGWREDRVVVSWSAAADRYVLKDCSLQIFEPAASKTFPRFERKFEKCEGPWSSTRRKTILGNLRSPDQFFRSDVFNTDERLEIRLQTSYLDAVDNLDKEAVTIVTLSALHPRRATPPNDPIFKNAAVLFLVAGIIFSFCVLLAVPCLEALSTTHRFIRGEASSDELLQRLFAKEGWRGFATVYLFVYFSKLTIATRAPLALGILIPVEDVAQLNLMATVMSKMKVDDWNTERMSLLARTK